MVQETLIIDPLIYSTYLGESLLEFGKAVAIDVQGNAYLTGYTKLTNFDIVAGANRATLAANYDAFITKVGTGGTLLVYST